MSQVQIWKRAPIPTLQTRKIVYGNSDVYGILNYRSCNKKPHSIHLKPHQSYTPPYLAMRLGRYVMVTIKERKADAAVTAPGKVPHTTDVFGLDKARGAIPQELDRVHLWPDPLQGTGRHEPTNIKKADKPLTGTA